MEQTENYTSYSTEDLVELISWKADDDYAVEAEKAFREFYFRFCQDVAQKCEIICTNWGYDVSTAVQLTERTFGRFWKYPNFTKDKAKSSNIDKAVLLYLLGIAKKELLKIRQDETSENPYTGEERIIKTFPNVDSYNTPIETKMILKKKYKIIQNALARLSEKHKIVYLTYKAYEKDGYNLPGKLLKELRSELNLSQSTIRFYKMEAYKKVDEYLEIYGQ
ncbi:MULTISPECIES: RNA polymerase subunit sigma [unclassified Lewinella]|uniref:RNA polymerase subunit sigma n=1 Tax=unclassified Lewinella TaxID=2637037 RepID=UPI000E264E17|nr:MULTISPECIES: RNA polymerase subunit sigma [unclassified Lewinella]